MVEAATIQKASDYLPGKKSVAEQYLEQKILEGVLDPDTQKEWNQGKLTIQEKPVYYRDVIDPTGSKELIDSTKQPETGVRNLREGVIPRPNYFVPRVYMLNYFLERSASASNEYEVDHNPMTNRLDNLEEVTLNANDYYKEFYQLMNEVLESEIEFHVDDKFFRSPFKGSQFFIQGSRQPGLQLNGHGVVENKNFHQNDNNIIAPNKELQLRFRFASNNPPQTLNGTNLHHHFSFEMRGPMLVRKSG